MIAVIFEVEPKHGRQDDYLEHAARMLPLAKATDGFISVERFQSLTDPKKLLSLSFFEDEAAVARWRNSLEHRKTQKAGRRGIFKDYRLRVAKVLRDYGMNKRSETPKDSQAAHD